MTNLNRAIQRLKELQDVVHGADACKLAGAIELLEEHQKQLNKQAEVEELIDGAGLK